MSKPDLVALADEILGDAAWADVHQIAKDGLKLARAVKSLASQPSLYEAGLEKIVSDLRSRSESAYCQYISQMRKPECLGFEHKVSAGTFGDLELSAHTLAGELLGKHRAFAEAATAIAALPADGGEVNDAAFGCKCVGGFVEHNCMAACDCDRTKDIQSSDGGAEDGSSPILASKEEMRARAHGVMPVGDSADASGCTDVGPSEATPSTAGSVREALEVPSGATHMRRPEYLTAWLYTGQSKKHWPKWFADRMGEVPALTLRPGRYATAVDGEFWRWFDAEKFDELFTPVEAPVEAPVAVKRPVLVDDQNSASGKRVEWHATPCP